MPTPPERIAAATTARRAAGVARKLGEARDTLERDPDAADDQVRELVESLGRMLERIAKADTGQTTTPVRPVSSSSAQVGLPRRPAADIERGERGWAIT